MALATHLKKNLWFIGITSSLAALTYRLPLPFIGQSLYQLLALSSPDFLKGSIWSLFTFFFAIPFSHTLSLYDVYQFAFDLAIITFLSHQILQKIKTSSFYIFFYGPSIAAAATLILLSYFFSFSFHLTGVRSIFFALLMTWTELYNTSNFFFSRNISTRTITVLTVGFSGLLDVANGAWIDLGMITFSILYAFILTKVLSLKPTSAINRVILEDAAGNPIFKEGSSSKVHSIHDGRELHKLLWWLREMKRKASQLFKQK